MAFLVNNVQETQLKNMSQGGGIVALQMFLDCNSQHSSLLTVLANPMGGIVQQHLKGHMFPTFTLSEAF